MKNCYIKIFLLVAGMIITAFLLKYIIDLRVRLLEKEFEVQSLKNDFEVHLRGERFFYKKFAPLNEELRQVAAMEYTEDFRCLEFSKELQKRLTFKGYQSSVMLGESPETLKEPKIKHAFLSIWIEPQTGFFTHNYEADAVYK